MLKCNQLLWLLVIDSQQSDKQKAMRMDPIKLELYKNMLT